MKSGKLWLLNNSRYLYSFIQSTGWSKIRIWDNPETLNSVRRYISFFRLFLTANLSSFPGSSFSRSFLARLEESRRPHGSTQVPNCTETDSGAPSSVSSSLKATFMNEFSVLFI
ncbi:hypothetical protein AVEN_108318-1 [Araneus ventricosus]|uniref:Uncharacterized protein n=1 Tax=Araneus ventricosus TaxID=182803 RepID=A0A4Y2M3Y4_ARAVE|nr:hypothetical protein AVEN_108318-1 [Araneus ventricosus]